MDSSAPLANALPSGVSLADPHPEGRRGGIDDVDELGCSGDSVRDLAGQPA